MANGSSHICPICGEENKPSARACRACGADERTGFFDDEGELEATGLDLPDDAFDYDTFVAAELGEKPKSRSFGLGKLVALGLAVLFVLYFVLR